ncbi:MAG: flippase-like domain-containing protein [Gemmataceae bacterium]|nr:flippase-like domain-containing protein [Gemmataceae bacterium]
MKRTILINLAKYGLGIGLLAYVVWSNWGPGPNNSPGLERILTQGEIHTAPLVLALLIMAVSLPLSFVRWYVLVRAQALPFTLTNAMRLGLIGYFWNTFFPGSVGGDAVKAFCLAREQSRRTVAVATVLIDRAVGLWALFWFVALLGSVFWLAGDPALLAKDELKIIVLGAIGLVVFTSILWTALLLLPERRAERFAGRLGRLPKVGVAASEFWRAIWMYRFQQRAVVLALLMALVGHVGWILVFYYSAQIVSLPGVEGQIPTATEHFVVVPIGMTVQALFPTPGGIGGGEYGYGRLYKMVGSSEGAGVLGSLVQRVITWLLALVGVLIYLRMPKVDIDGQEAAPNASEEAETDSIPAARGVVSPSMSTDP